MRAISKLVLATNVYIFSSHSTLHKINVWNILNNVVYRFILSLYRRPRWLRRGSAAARLLGLRVRIPPGACTYAYYECCVLTGRVVLCRADHSSRGILLSAVCLSVNVSHNSEEAMAHYRLMWHKKTLLCWPDRLEVTEVHKSPPYIWT